MILFQGKPRYEAVRHRTDTSMPWRVIDHKRMVYILGAWTEQDWHLANSKADQMNGATAGKGKGLGHV